MQRLQIKVTHEIGLHARPASLLVSQAAQYSAEIRIRNLTSGSDWADAKSILGVLGLGVEKDHEVDLSAEGLDEQQAISDLRQLILNLASEPA